MSSSAGSRGGACRRRSSRCTRAGAFALTGCLLPSLLGRLFTASGAASQLNPSRCIHLALLLLLLGRSWRLRALDWCQRLLGVGWQLESVHQGCPQRALPPALRVQRRSHIGKLRGRVAGQALGASGAAGPLRVAKLHHHTAVACAEAHTETLRIGRS